jgi:hypothetical protein
LSEQASVEERGALSYHFTLAHKHPATIVRKTTCRFPCVATTRAKSVRSRKKKHASTMRRNVGCNDEPGSRMFEKKEDVLSRAVTASTGAGESVTTLSKAVDAMQNVCLAFK